MDGLIAFLPFALLLLACPLMMVSVAVGAWVIARVKGEKKDLSISCMGGNCNHAEHAGQGNASELQKQVSELRQEVEALREGNAQPISERRRP